MYCSDYIVVYSNRGDKVLVREITSEQGDSGRFTQNALLSTLGYTQRDKIQLFVKNNNLHCAGNGLRGPLLLINYRIGLILKSRGSFILFQVLYPSRERGQNFILDLRKKDRYYGFFLQQVYGARVLKLQASKNKTRFAPYPYTIEGHVYMNPDGPDFCIPPTSVPEEFMKRFNRLPDNFCFKNYSTPSPHIRNLRNAKSSLVVYVADSFSRTYLGERANCFYAPVGEPIPVECPWESRDGSNAMYV